MTIPSVLVLQLQQKGMTLDLGSNERTWSNVIRSFLGRYWHVIPHSSRSNPKRFSSAMLR